MPVPKLQRLPITASSPCDQHTSLTRSVLLHNSPTSLFHCNGACFAAFYRCNGTLLHRHTARMHGLPTPKCCKIARYRCFTATKRVWLYFRRCRGTLPRFQAAMGRCNESLLRNRQEMGRCRPTMEHCT